MEFSENFKSSAKDIVLILAVFSALILNSVSFSQSFPQGSFVETEFSVKGTIFSRAGEYPNHPYMWNAMPILYLLLELAFPKGILGTMVHSKILTLAFSCLACSFVYLFVKSRSKSRVLGLFSALTIALTTVFVEMSTHGFLVELMIAFFSCVFLFIWEKSGGNLLLLSLVSAVALGSKLLFLHFLLPFSIVFFLRENGIARTAALLVFSLSGALVFSKGIDIFSTPSLMHLDAPFSYFFNRISGLFDFSVFFKGELSDFVPQPLTTVFFVFVLASLLFPGDMRRWSIAFFLSLFVLAAVPVALAVQVHTLVAVPLGALAFSFGAKRLFERKGIWIPVLGIVLALSFFSLALFVGLPDSSEIGALHPGYEAETYVIENLADAQRHVFFLDVSRAFSFERDSFLLNYYEKANQLWRGKDGDYELALAEKSEFPEGGGLLIFVSKSPAMRPYDIKTASEYEVYLEEGNFSTMLMSGEKHSGFSVFYRPG